MKQSLISFALTSMLLIGMNGYSDNIIQIKKGDSYRLPGRPGDAVSSNLFQSVGEVKISSDMKSAAPRIPAISETKTGRIIHIGPGQLIKSPRMAARIARSGDVVEIEAGVYSGAVASWRQHNLTIRGIGGKAHIKAAGRSAAQKAIWVIKGDNVIVENVEFSGARVPDKNGAGIRFEGHNLTVRNCHFHDNEMGILTGGKKKRSEILIEGSEFNNNSVDYERYGKLGHNIYIGRIHRFTLSNSYIHHARTGHNVKTRARENYILYNRIMDEEGNSSYLLDMAEGGDAYVIGNLFQQSRRGDNIILLSFAAEKNRENPEQTLYVVNNTFKNDSTRGIFVKNNAIEPARLVNNLFVGIGKPLLGNGQTIRNRKIDAAGLRDADAFDYRLVEDSPAINQGVDPGRADNGFSLRPTAQYLHPRQMTLRPGIGNIDLGAYEYSED